MPRRKIRVKDTPEYRAWYNMRVRCRYQKGRGWNRYGGRGIKIAPEFDTFEGFLRHIGYRPEGCSLDRIDNDGDYAPGNVRWANIKTQMLNRSRKTLISFGGKTQTITEWAEELAMSFDTLWCRIRQYGWSPERALTTPVRPHKPYTYVVNHGFSPEGNPPPDGRR